MFPASHEIFASPLLKAGELAAGCSGGHGEISTADAYYVEFSRTAGWIEPDDDSPFIADANVTSLYNPGSRYRRRHLAREGRRADWISLAPALMRRVFHGHTLANEEDRPLFPRHFARLSPALYLKQRELFDQLRSGAEATHVEQAAVRLLREIFAIGDRTPHSDVDSLRHRVLAEDARAQLNLRFAEHQGLEELAAGLRTSPFHLCRIFRRCTGWTIHQYRHQLRLRASLELLESVGDDITSVALALGYSGHSHFSAAFQRCYGMTPSAFRDAASRASARRRLQSLKQRTATTR